jgi:pyrroline-5-carboxylate reductase
MSERVGIIGTGHLAGYLVEGLRRAAPEMEIVLSPRNAAKAAELASRFGARVARRNQEVVDSANVVLLTTRPAQAIGALGEITLRPGQLIISAAATVRLQELEPAAAPAAVVRALPLSCAAINASPTLLYPDHERARSLLERLGDVHNLASEEAFVRAGVITAFYGWVYALLDETARWTEEGGVPREAARSIVLETVRGAASLGLARQEEELCDLLEALATPGGITRQGLAILRDRGGLSAWIDALDAVYARLRQWRPE